MSILEPIPEEEESMLRPIRLSERDMEMVVESVLAEPRIIPAMARQLQKNREWRKANTLISDVETQ